jgi:hypothetical protein
MPSNTTFATFLSTLALAAPLATAQATWTSSPEILPARQGLAATTVGNLALFAGGFDGQNKVEVNIYDSTTNTWTAAALSVGRTRLAATSVGNMALFAGGRLPNNDPMDTVDLYDAQTGDWTQATLSVARISPAATSVGGFAIFAGGEICACPDSATDVVDVYEPSTGLWSQTTLSIPRSQLAATTVGPYALFAGGNYQGTPYETVVDVYDSTVGPPTDPTAWSLASLAEGRIWITATTAGSKAYFAGGFTNPGTSALVDVYDSCIGPPSDPAAWSVEYLSIPRLFMAAASDGEKAIFAGGSSGWGPSFTNHTEVEVFDGESGTWSMESLSVGRHFLAATSVGNQALFAGGYGDAGFYGSVDIRTATRKHWYVEALAAAPGNGSPEVPFPTIQAAVNAAQSGDTVHVAPGTYTEPTVVIDRDVNIIGTCGREVTILQKSPWTDRVVVVTNGAIASFDGLTLTDGFSFGPGGGLHAQPGTTVTMVDCVVSNCDAVEFGGGIYAENATLTLRSTRLEGNTVYPGTFGGAWSTHTEGGGLCASGSVATLLDCEVIGNEASASLGAFGGGIHSAGGNVRVENTLIAHNSIDHEAQYEQGGAVYGPMTLVGCTIVDNEWPPVASGLIPITITNSIVWDSSGVPLSLIWANVSYSLVSGGYAGTGNIDLDPLFANPLAGDYRLLSNSPAIDAADNGAVGAGVLSDLAGRPRYRDDASTPDTGIGPTPVVDMGAYEFQPRMRHAPGAPRPGSTITLP